MKALRTLPTMPRATGRAKNGMGDFSMRSKMSLMRSGGIIEPSA